MVKKYKNIASDKLAKMSLIEHFAEFKRRFIYSFLCFIIMFFLSWHYREFILSVFTLPLIKGNIIDHLIFTKITEAFTAYLKLSFIFGLFLSAPFILSQIWLFISPALLKNEKRPIFWLSISAFILFILGSIFAYFVIIPITFDFFTGFQKIAENSNSEITSMLSKISIVMEPKISDYISIVQSFLIAFGIAFQLPIFLIAMVKFGLISVESLKNNRKYAFLFAFIIGAILTPPDVLSQLMLALPLFVLYESSILIIRIFKIEDKN